MSAYHYTENRPRGKKRSRDAVIAAAWKRKARQLKARAKRLEAEERRRREGEAAEYKVIVQDILSDPPAIWAVRSAKEHAFLTDMLCQFSSGQPPTPRQRAWIEAVYRRRAA